MKKAFKIMIIAAAVITAATIISGCRDAKRDNTHASKVAEISDSDRLSVTDYRTKLFETFKKYSASSKTITSGLYGMDGEKLSFDAVCDAIDETRTYLDEFAAIYPPKSLDKPHNEMLLSRDDEYAWVDAAEKANDALAANNSEALKAATEEAAKYLNETTFPAKMLELVKAVNNEIKE